jgi:hypothetical protein
MCYFRRGEIKSVRKATNCGRGSALLSWYRLIGVVLFQQAAFAQQIGNQPA